MNQFLFRFFKWCFERSMFVTRLQNFLKELTHCCCSTKSDADRKTELSATRLSLREKGLISSTEVSAILSVPWLFLYLQCFVSACTILVTAIFIRKWISPGTPRFIRYSTFYGIIVNSSVSTSTNSLLSFFLKTKKKSIGQRGHATQSITDSAKVERDYTTSDSAAESSNASEPEKRSMLDFLSSRYHKHLAWHFDPKQRDQFSRSQQLVRAWFSKDEFKLPLMESRTLKYSSIAKFTTFVFVSQLLFVVPPLITHILPGIGMYGLLLLAPFGILKLGRRMFCWTDEKRSKNASRRPVRQPLKNGLETAFEHTIYLLSRVFQRFVFIFVMQTLFNYMNVVYFPPPDLPSQYFGVIEYEFNLRSQTACFLTRLSDTQVRSTLMLLSWL